MNTSTDYGRPPTLKVNLNQTFPKFSADAGFTSIGSCFPRKTCRGFWKRSTARGIRTAILYNPVPSRDGSGTGRVRGSLCGKWIFSLRTVSLLAPRVFSSPGSGSRRGFSATGLAKLLSKNCRAVIFWRDLSASAVVYVASAPGLWRTAIKFRQSFAPALLCRKMPRSCDRIVGCRPAG